MLSCVLHTFRDFNNQVHLYPLTQASVGFPMLLG